MTFEYTVDGIQAGRKKKKLSDKATFSMFRCLLDDLRVHVMSCLLGAMEMKPESV